MGFSYELGTIGGGNMAEGIVAAVVARGLYPAARIIVSDPLLPRRRFFAERFGTAVTEDNRQLAAQSRRIMIAVKPQNFAEVAAGFADAVGAEHLLISILAGLSTRRIAEAFTGIKARVVRVMPNLPIRVGAGMAGVCPGEHATPQDLTDTRAIFDAGGSTVVVNEEGLLDAVTAVSGSGPAYFYYFVEAMVAGGVACGLSEADALKLAAQTCLGAARMMLETGEPPAELRRKVCSKGGTTQKAIDWMNEKGVGQAIAEAAQASFRRARELGS
jgi:pyrroline-5-carboxylate reductase